LNLRYGVSEKVNLSATLPYYSIVSSKIQGAPYTRTNRGLGDLVLTAQMAVHTGPQIVLEAGLEVPTGNVDKTDQFGQRICDILSLGSGTWDPILGGSIWIPHVGTKDLDLVAGLRERFSGGKNKWGYQFGSQFDFNAHSSYKVSATTRLGLRVEGYHAGKDTWYGNRVNERGATMVYAGPTVSWLASSSLSVGAFARFPVLMNLEGSQMVAPAVLGLEFSSSLGDVLNGFLGNGGTN